jgi:23S rRNA (cytidine1920-2'-O)/16S rRNA (cytidine1409-2'-O)-methyltransferase
VPSEGIPSESRRLDTELAARGLVRSRNLAAELIASGGVTVDGHPARKAALKVTDASIITVAEQDAWVSRAAKKLVAALDSFDIHVTGRVVLDLGTSTGGFAQVLLERGADTVLGIEVGHGQLAALLRDEPRLRLAEGVNARDLTPELLAQVTGDARQPGLVVADLSFISLGLVLPAALACASVDADFVLLVKPQFEVGRQGIREGLVTDAALRADAVAGVLWQAWDLGLGTLGVIPSPIAGSSGNYEYLIWLRASAGSNPTEWLDTVNKLTKGER